MDVINCNPDLFSQQILKPRKYLSLKAHWFSGNVAPDDVNRKITVLGRGLCFQFTDKALAELRVLVQPQDHSMAATWQPPKSFHADPLPDFT